MIAAWGWNNDRLRILVSVLGCSLLQKLSCIFCFLNLLSKQNIANSTVAYKAPEMLSAFAILHSDKKKHANDICFPSGSVVLGEWEL